MEIGKVCIASWGSYNACNETEATLGVWVDFNDFEELSEIEEHLKNKHSFDIGLLQIHLQCRFSQFVLLLAKLKVFVLRNFSIQSTDL